MSTNYQVGPRKQCRGTIIVVTSEERVALNCQYFIYIYCFLIKLTWLLEFVREIFKCLLLKCFMRYLFSTVSTPTPTTTQLLTTPGIYLLFRPISIPILEESELLRQYFYHNLRLIKEYFLIKSHRSLPNDGLQSSIQFWLPCNRQ